MNKIDWRRVKMALIKYTSYLVNLGIIIAILAGITWYIQTLFLAGTERVKRIDVNDLNSGKIGNEVQSKAPAKK